MVIHPSAFAEMPPDQRVVALDLADFIDEKGMAHIRGAPYHPQTHGKIERWRQTMTNVCRGSEPSDQILILLTRLGHYFLPGKLERRIGVFVEHDNTARDHESLGNLTPADVPFGRVAQILKPREALKRKLARGLCYETENA